MVETSASRKSDKYLPGEEGVWAFVLGDLMIFALLFGTYLFYRSGAPAEYDAAQRGLSLTFGTLNTLILLTSSLMVALGVRAARHGAARDTRRLLLAAAGLGAAFCCIKLLEYRDKFSAGIGVETNEFYMFFFMLTGIHLIHVLIGITVLVLISAPFKQPPVRAENISVLESGATFWHLIDLLWIILFSLLYLLRS